VGIPLSPTNVFSLEISPVSGRDKRLKLCFSTPELEVDTPTHHFHLYELLEALGKEIKIFVVVDKPTIKPYPLRNVEQIHLTRFGFFPLRKLEQLFIFFLAHLKGYKTFYVHYSLWNGLLTALIQRFGGGNIPLGLSRT